MTVADVNRDGKPDLIVSDNGGGNNGDGAVAILLGNGDGTFQPPMTYDAGGCYTSSVAVADLNRDGKLDIVLDSPACATNSTALSEFCWAKAMAPSSPWSLTIQVAMIRVRCLP